MILNTISLGLGWVVLVIVMFWIIGQFILWIVESITTAKKTLHQREEQLIRTCTDIENVCGHEYPEIRKCCEIISAQMGNSNQTMSSYAFLTWLHKYYPKM